MAAQGPYYQKGLRYLVFSGDVTSRYDGQRHHVRATDTIRLYGIAPNLCVLWTPRGPGKPKSDYDGLIRLFPRNDGDYTLPVE